MKSEVSIYLWNMIFLLSKYCVQLDIWEVALCMLSRFSYIQLFVTAWTIAHQAPLCMEFSRQEYWSGHSFLQGIFPAQGDSLPSEPPGFLAAAAAKSL